MAVDAIARRIEEIGEVSKRLAPETMATMPRQRGAAGLLTGWALVDDNPAPAGRQGATSSASSTSRMCGSRAAASCSAGVNPALLISTISGFAATFVALRSAGSL